MKELGYHSISAFIRDTILDEKLTVEICQDPVKYDYSHSIRQLITAIHTLDKRWIRAEKEFMDACNIPGVDPTLIHRHAYRVRRIVVELVNKLEYLTNLLGSRMRRNLTYSLVSLSSKSGLSKSTDTSYSSNPRN